MEKERYTVKYISGATGDGWEMEASTPAKAMYLIGELRHDESAFLSVWDNKKHEQAFYKSCCIHKIETCFNI